MAGANDWNPMVSGFNDQHLNSYDKGPGRNFQASGAAKDNSKLYIKNVPKELTEDGLRNVFTNAAGAVPNRVIIPMSKVGSQYLKNFAFVEFDNPSEASKAIMALHKSPPLNLDVTYQKPKTDQGVRNQRQYDTLLPRAEAPVRRDPPTDLSGVIDWEGVRRAGFDGDCGRREDRAWSDPKDAFVEPRAAGRYDPRGGASGAADVCAARDADFVPRLSVSAGADGRKVSLGRGYFPPAAAAGVNSPINRQSAAPQQSPLAAVPVAKVPPAAETFPELPCQFCMRPATNVCKLCAVTRYCNGVCADKHWNAHLHVCVMLCKPPGVLVKEEVVKAPVAAVSSPVEAVVVTPTKAASGIAAPVVQAAAHGIDNYEDIPLGEITAVTVATAEGSTAWVSVDARGDRAYAMVIAVSKRKDLGEVAAPRVGQHVAAYFCGEWYRARVVKLSPLTVFYVDYGNTEEVLLDQIRSLPAEYLREPAQAVRVSVMPSANGTRRTLSANQPLSVCAVRRDGDFTLVRLKSDVVNGDKAVPAASAAVATKLPCESFVQPLFTDRAVKVYFVSKDGDARHIQPVESSPMMGAMLAEFDALAAASALKPCAAAAVGRVALVKFEGDWSRCKILAAETGNKFRIMFIDYGNECSVGANEIYELPEKHTLIPGQCVKAQFADTPAAVIELPEFKIFLATLIAETQNGSLVVRATLEQ